MKARTLFEHNPLRKRGTVTQVLLLTWNHRALRSRFRREAEPHKHIIPGGTWNESKEDRLKPIHQRVGVPPSGGESFKPSTKYPCSFQAKPGTRAKEIG